MQAKQYGTKLQIYIQLCCIQKAFEEKRARGLIYNTVMLVTAKNYEKKKYMLMQFKIWRKHELTTPLWTARREHFLNSWWRHKIEKISA